MDSENIRKIVRSQRQQLSFQKRKEYSLNVLEYFLLEDVFKTNHHIACFHSLTEEIDTQPIIEMIWKKHKKCYLPVLRSQALAFVLYEPKTTLIKNIMGILEPKNQKNCISPTSLDLILMPLVAFDIKGHRIGMGKGYYDHTFGAIRKSERPILCGLAYSFQEVEIMKPHKKDIALDMVITEKDIKKFS